jgi:hydroxymethylpyrimidine/phosphomethylpyrimidine kinase
MNERQNPKVMSIAGSDSSCGAGIQADLKTFCALGVYGTTVITAITAQNSTGVYSIQNMNPQIILDQLKALYEDISICAIKIGMLSNTTTIKAVKQGLDQYFPSTPFILDPVMVSKSGFKLLEPTAIELLKKELIPMAEIVTPNIPEAEILVGYSISTLQDMQKAAGDLISLGCKAAIIKGGHFKGEPTDVLQYNGQTLHLTAPRIINGAHSQFHGTGCSFSSAITAFLARGDDVLSCVKKAKEYISRIITHNQVIGKGVLYLDHFK